MLKYLTSMGADSSFEKNRLMVTAKNLEAPEEHIIKSENYLHLRDPEDLPGRG